MNDVIPRVRRELFSGRSAAILTMVGVSIGLGNVWRFPYMVGRFGGAAFVLFYLLAVALVGVPALVAEWTLGRHTRKGSVGAFEAAGLPGGRWLGRVLFVTVAVAGGYYTNAIGWVVYHGIAEMSAVAGLSVNASSILPPDEGFGGESLALQLLFTGLILAGCAWILSLGIRRGVERASRWLVPILFVALLLLISRSLTLDGAFEGVQWLLFKFEPEQINGAVAFAALGQVAFSLALGGTFMVVYGSYLSSDERLVPNAWTTAGADTAAGLLAGLAIFPAVFALGLEPASGPALIFSTLPEVFARVGGGHLFGVVFFFSLAGVASLSLIAALEVAIEGLIARGWHRGRASWTVGAGVLVLALPPMFNMGIFVPWDLFFGTGMQTFGALMAAITVGWSLNRRDFLAQVAPGGEPALRYRLLHGWIRWVIPSVILAVGVWWLLGEVFGLVGTV